MIMKEEFLKKLRGAFDLNIYEVKIWTALLSRGIATAGELSDISNVPRSRSYDILESLEKKGFVIMKLGKPIKYMAVKPEDILKRLKESIKDRANSKVEFLDTVKTDEVFNELELLYKQGIKKVDIASLSGALKGRDNVYYHLKQMLERAQKSVIISTTAQGLQRKAKRFKSILAKLAEKGVQIKIVAPLQNGNNNAHVSELKNIAKIKNIDKLNSRFVIIDDTEMLFMVTDDSTVHESYDTAVWVSTPYFVKSFVSMFNSAFKE
ncbi:MAG: helix-turn-helix domain-containing protein [Nanoarchaeota archaeon]